MLIFIRHALTLKAYSSVHLYTFLYISIWLGILVLDNSTPSGTISYQSQARWRKIQKKVCFMWKFDQIDSVVIAQREFWMTFDYREDPERSTIDKTV